MKFYSKPPFTCTLLYLQGNYGTVRVTLTLQSKLFPSLQALRIAADVNQKVERRYKLLEQTFEITKGNLDLLSDILAKYKSKAKSK